MNQQYKPMLAKTSPKPFSNQNWIYEIKWDGFRAIAYINKDFSIMSRNQIRLENKFPELKELQTLTKNAVLDGEIVIIKNNKTDFQAMLDRLQANSSFEIETKSKTQPATYMIFDILEKNGKTLTNKPLQERKRRP